MAAISPGILSYAPFPLRWDEAFYAHRVVCMDREFYNFSVRGMENCLAGTHKGPAIELAGLPWGPAGSGEAGIGLALVGLALINFILALATFRVCLRAGAAPWALALAGAGIGLAPLVQQNGGALMTDVMVAWCSALAVMLVAMEFQTRDDAAWPSFWRGGLWVSVIMLGSLAKMTFAVFAVAVIPGLFYARWRRCPTRSLMFTAMGFVLFAIPGLVVWILCGRAMVDFALLAAFSETAALWRVPGLGPGGYLWRFFSELGFALVPLAILALIFARRLWREKVRMLPVAIVLGFLFIAALGQNREPRYTITVAVALPLAFCWNSLLPSRPVHLGFADYLGGLFLALLLAVPMVARPRLTPIRHVGELLGVLSHGQPATFVIATDGPEYNIEVFQLARQIGGTRLQPVYLDTLVYDAINKRTPEDGDRRMASADYVLFLKPEFAAGPTWSRQWAGQYRTYAEDHGVPLAVPASPEFDVFRMKK